MVRFADTTTMVIRGGSCNSNASSEERKWEARNVSQIVGQKRRPSTPHPASLEGLKKRSPGNDSGSDDDDDNEDDNHIDAETRMCIALQENNSSNSMLQSNTIGHFEPSGSNDLVAYRHEGGANAANLPCNKNGREQEEKRIPGSTGCNKEIDNKNDELEESLEMLGEGSSNDDQNKGWKEFVDIVDTTAIPNLETYIKAKAIRTETSTRFVNAIDECIQTLRDTTDEILSDVVEPICNRYSERFDDTEENVIKMMVSNHSRRNKLMELMHNADVAWSNKYNKLTTEIVGENQVDQKRDIDRDSVDVENDKGVGTNEGKATSQCPSKGFSSESNKEKTIFGHEDSDWEELLEYEPSRERILSFLDERVKRNHTMRTFGESLDAVHSGLESEVEAILHIASDLFNQHEIVRLESEDEIEYYIMENYERRGNLQTELEKSAQHAQGLFASLLSRLSQSVS